MTPYQKGTNCSQRKRHVKIPYHWVHRKCILAVNPVIGYFIFYSICIDAKIKTLLFKFPKQLVLNEIGYEEPHGERRGHQPQSSPDTAIK